jgi:hypothetical protein
MNLEDYVNNPLWSILVDTVHTIILYPHYKSYIRDIMIPEKPDIQPQDLTSKLGISLGEALVIIFELQVEKKTAS